MKYLSTLLLTGALLGASATILPAFAQDVYNSGATITLLGGASIYVPGNLTNTGGGIISSSGSSVKVDGDVLNNAASTYNMGTAGSLEVGGNMVSSAATFTPGTGTLTMSRTTGAQNLDMNGAQVYKLVVNNTAATNKRVDVLSDVTVNNLLTLTSGLVRTTAAANVILPDGATIDPATPETNGKYVAGNLQVTRNAVSGGSPVVYPNSVNITPNASLGNLTVTRTAGLLAPQVSYGTNSTNAFKGIDRIWTFSTPPGAASSVTFSWLMDNDNGNSGFTSSRVWARTAAPVAGQDWTGVGSYQNAASRSITVPGGAFSFWTVSTLAQPLPVELLTFTAVRQGDAAQLDWRTVSEHDNDHWNVQVSTNGAEFRTFAKVAGHGSTTAPATYTLNDPALLKYNVGTVYYRLEQVDTNGISAYSPVRAVLVDVKGFAALAYPNPVGQQGTTVAITTATGGPATLALYDATGRYLSGTKVELLTGRTDVAMPEAGQLATGVYFLKIAQGQQHTMLKLNHE